MLHQKTPFTVLLAVCSVAVCLPALPAENNTGKTHNEAEPELTLTIRCEKPDLKVGDEIPIVFVIKNEGITDYKYMDRSYDRSGRMHEYELSAVDEQGNGIPDPRAKPELRIGGGLAGEGRLAPGESYAKTIALNRWALLTEPGVYGITGTYRLGGNRPGIASRPIRIELQPRTDDEMAAYVKDLSTQLAVTSVGGDRAAVVRKLMYTCDRRIVPALVEAMYKSDAASYWAVEAFKYYLPDDQEIYAAFLGASLNRGLAVGMLRILKHRGLPSEQIKPLIEVSLSPEHPDAWRHGALAAQQYADDRFTTRLIAIATDPKTDARSQAIYALAFNRTDASVAALKGFLREPDPPHPIGRTIRQTTEHAIRTAYLGRGNTEGRRLRKDDFDPKYQVMP